MRRALLNDYVWIAGAEGSTSGIMVCLRTGAVVATVAVAGGGWRGRAFVSPLRSLALWRKGHLRHCSIKASRKGFVIVHRGRDPDCVQQSIEGLAVRI